MDCYLNQDKTETKLMHINKDAYVSKREVAAAGDCRSA